MYKLGDRVEGTIINAKGEDERVIGAFQFRTDDPEEFIQDIVIRTDDGALVYIDEQEAYPARKD